MYFVYVYSLREREYERKGSEFSMSFVCLVDSVTIPSLTSSLRFWRTLSPLIAGISPLLANCSLPPFTSFWLTLVLDAMDTGKLFNSFIHSFIHLHPCELCVRSCDGCSAFSFYLLMLTVGVFSFQAADVTKLLLIKQHKISESEIYYLKKYWYPSNFWAMSCSRFQYLSCNHSNTD